MQKHQRRAFSLLAAPEVTRAFDLSREPARVRERYGMNMHGQSVLQARRLVEAGVSLVTVFWPNDGITNVSVYWDTHSRNFIDLKSRLCPVTDLAFSSGDRLLQQVRRKLRCDYGFPRGDQAFGVEWLCHQVTIPDEQQVTWWHINRLRIVL